MPILVYYCLFKWEYKQFGNTIKFASSFFQASTITIIQSEIQSDIYRNPSPHHRIITHRLQRSSSRNKFPQQVGTIAWSTSATHGILSAAMGMAIRFFVRQRLDDDILSDIKPHGTRFPTIDFNKYDLKTPQFETSLQTIDIPSWICKGIVILCNPLR